jgi:ribose/xylose/arabinose/galactoside ABC-type transport system permease subunit
MDMKKVMKNTVITIALPLGMFLLMVTLTRIKGVTYYGSLDMWRIILNKLGLSITVALGIAMQLRFGRMDFSGGITMFLSGFAGVLVAQNFGNNPLVMLAVSIFCGLILSMITATVYTVARLPIIICTVALTLLYEAMTMIIGGGKGANIMGNGSLNIFGRMPVALIVLAAAIAIYHFVTTYTTAARQSALLKNGQQIAVNIGINEKRNIYTAYVFSGILFGLAGVVYASQNMIETQSNLSTSSILFSYIVPVYIGFFLGKFSVEVIGIIAGSITIQFMNYGLNALGLGSAGWDSITFGIFMMSFWVITTKIDSIKKLFSFAKSTRNKAIN